MPSANVRMPWPLVRQNAFETGQMGVPGTWSETGLRQSCTGAIFWVDPNYPGVWDGAGNAVDRDGTDPNDPCATIALALTKCQDYRGDMIVVMANDSWTLGENAEQVLPIRESVTVSVHGVKIVGMSPSGALGVKWQPVSGSTPAIYVEAMDVLIEGFAFDGVFDPAILTRWDSPDYYGDNLTVRNCWFGLAVPDPNFIQTCIEFRWMYHADIHHNWFMRPELFGITANPNFGAPRYCKIHHNHFLNAGLTAVYMENAQWCKIYENEFVDDRAIQGLAATDSMVFTTGTGIGNAVHHNTMTCLLPAAAPGDYNDCNSPAVPGGPNVDAWIHNYCLNGPSVTVPT